MNAMEYVRLGFSNLTISRLGLGAMGFGDKAWREWVLDEAASRSIVRGALDHGINFFDTCDFYSAGRSEEVLKATLLNDVPRHSVVIATKVGNPMHSHPNGRGYSRKHIIEAAEASLRRLGTDYIDLYQTHIWDPHTNLEELAEAFDSLVRAGKVLYLGATTMPAWTFCRLDNVSRQGRYARFVSMQCEYNPAHREAEREMIPFCRAEDIGLVPFSPVARGFLAADRRLAQHASDRTRTDDYTRKHYGREADYEVYEAIAKVAENCGASPAQVSLAWTAQRPGVTAPIFGATEVRHVDEAVQAIGLSLNEAAVASIAAAYSPRPRDALGH